MTTPKTGKVYSLTQKGRKEGKKKGRYRKTERMREQEREKGKLGEKERKL